MGSSPFGEDRPRRGEGISDRRKDGLAGKRLFLSEEHPGIPDLDRTGTRANSIHVATYALLSELQPFVGDSRSLPPAGGRSRARALLRTHTALRGGLTWRRRRP